jgi:phosphoribosylanthranilate isomerase
MDQFAITNQLDPYRGLCDSILLDTYDPIVGGGTGETFAWNRIPAYQAWAAEAGMPLIIAGGLKPDNVGELITNYKPDGVDVSSGVETAGAKDILLIKAFIERVRSA